MKKGGRFIFLYINSARGVVHTKLCKNLRIACQFSFFSIFLVIKFRLLEDLYYHYFYYLYGLAPYPKDNINKPSSGLRFFLLIQYQLSSKPG
jgi:hypothetical protein